MQLPEPPCFLPPVYIIYSALYNCLDCIPLPVTAFTMIKMIPTIDATLHSITPAINRTWLVVVNRTSTMKL